jgi:hypothetical protein
VHVGVDAEDLGADDGVLGEVLRHAAADHEQARDARRDLDVGQLAEVGDRVQHHVGLALGHALLLVLDQAETGRGVDEGRAEDRRAFFIGGLDQRAGLLGVAFRQPLAHFPDELARGIAARLQAAGDLIDGVVAGLQFFFVDVGVVDAVDVVRAQDVVVHLAGGLIVLEAQGFEEVHVDDRGAGGDHGVDHAELHHVAVDVHAAAGRGRTGQDQPRRAGLVFQGHVEDVGRAGGVARGERHLAHGIDDRARVEAGDVDVLDGRGQELRLGVGTNRCVHLSGFPLV